MPINFRTMIACVMAVIVAFATGLASNVLVIVALAGADDWVIFAMNVFLCLMVFSGISAAFAHWDIFAARVFAIGVITVPLGLLMSFFFLSHGTNWIVICVLLSVGAVLACINLACAQLVHKHLRHTTRG